MGVASRFGRSSKGWFIVTIARTPSSSVSYGHAGDWRQWASSTRNRRQLSIEKASGGGVAYLSQVLLLAQRQRAEQQQRLDAAPPRAALLVLQREVVEQRHVEELRISTHALVTTRTHSTDACHGRHIGRRQRMERHVRCWCSSSRSALRQGRQRCSWPVLPLPLVVLLMVASSLLLLLPLSSSSRGVTSMGSSSSVLSSLSRI